MATLSYRLPRPISCSLLWLAVVVGSISFGGTAGAQASLASEDQIDDAEVNIDGVKETFTIIRDALQQDQFYYMPNGPRLYERSVNGKIEPEFTLVRYQFPDPANPAALMEGGLIQFSATMAAPPGALDQMKARIQKSYKHVGQNIRLAAMPLKTANVDIIAPKGSSLVASAQGGGIAPVLSTQKMAFMLELTDRGTDVYDALVKSDTGVGIRVGFTYLGLTPKAGFTVDVDWDQTYKMYSKDQKFAAKASYLGLVSASANADKQAVAESLINNNCIKVNGRTGENFTQQQMDTYLQAILSRINTEMLEAMKAPTSVDPAVAKDPDPAAGKYLSAGYSVSIKDVSKVKKGHEKFDFNFQQIVERTTIASGFIGLAKYHANKELMNRLVIVAAPGFKSAYFMLPPVGDKMGIQQVDLELSLQSNHKNYMTTTAEWTPKVGWVYKNQPGSVVPIPLTGLPAELQGKPVEDMKFYIETKIQVESGQYFVAHTTSDVFNGRKSVAPPLAAVDVVQVNGSVLPWKMINKEDKLVEASITLESAGTSYFGRLQAKRDNGQYVQPDPLTFFFQRPSGDGKAPPITATVSYKFIGRPPITEKTLDLRDPAIALSLWLDPTTWPADASGPAVPR